MEGLLAEINKKKEATAGESSGGSKYMRRGEAERAAEAARERKRDEDRRKREEEEDAERERKSERAGRMRKEAEAMRNASLSALADGDDTPGGSPAPDAAAKERGQNITWDECVRRLRSKGQPIRLFGETDKDVRHRLRALELLGDRGSKDQVDFKRAVEDLEARELERKARGEDKTQAEKEKSDKRRQPDGPLDLGLIKTDFNKLHPLIYWAFKNLLNEWEEWLAARPDDVRRSTEGKLAAANHAQSAQNLKPLFRMLRSREAPEGVVRLLAEVVHYVQIRSYQKANDAYLRLSIGNAAWPLGVTSVGIHARSSQGKITDNIAHVLNDEVSRKYIQAVKRLLTFSQTVRPPDSISQMMG